MLIIIDLLFYMFQKMISMLSFLKVVRKELGTYDSKDKKWKFAWKKGH